MSLPQTAPKWISRKDYLAAEQTSVEKHEWIHGDVVVMQGGTYRHSRVNANLLGTLHATLRGGPCFVLESNMRLWLASARRYTYPDAQIICGKPEFDPVDKNRTTILNPQVIFEVLSDSTEKADRGDKFRGAIGVPSLHAYVLVSQHMPRVECFLRQTDGPWVFQWFEGMDATVSLPLPELTLAMSEIYSGVEFDPPPEPEPRDADGVPA